MLHPMKYELSTYVALDLQKAGAILTTVLWYNTMRYSHDGQTVTARYSEGSIFRRFCIQG